MREVRCRRVLDGGDGGALLGMAFNSRMGKLLKVSTLGGAFLGLDK